MNEYYSQNVGNPHDGVNIPLNLAVILVHNLVGFIADYDNGVWEFTVPKASKQVLDTTLIKLEKMSNEVLHKDQ